MLGQLSCPGISGPADDEPAATHEMGDLFHSPVNLDLTLASDGQTRQFGPDSVRSGR